MRPHLLVPTDFSMPAKKMVKNLDDFRFAGAERITLLHVREAAYPAQTSLEQDDYFRELLEETATDLRSRGWRVDIRKEEGRPGSRIVELAEEVGADMIVLANHGHAALSEVVLGSVAADVLERAKKPVFLFCSKAVDAPLWDRIVHPTDFSEAADRARSWAAELALEEGSPLVLLHAVDDRYSSERTAQKRRKKLETLRAELKTEGLDSVEIQTVHGPPKKMVVEAADHYPGALFVMGSQGRGWFGDLLLGGTSRAMARRGTHHVLFIR